MNLLEKLWKSCETDKRKRLAVLAGIGILLILGGEFGSRDSGADVRHKEGVVTDKGKNNNDGDVSSAVNNSAKQAGEREEQRLAEILSSVKGAGRVDVRMLVIGSGSREFEHNRVSEMKVTEEKNDNGAVRTTRETKENNQVLNSKEKGSELPVVIRETGPEIGGVIIVADGAESIAVKENLLRAAEVFGVPMYKITVLPRRK